VSVLPGAAAGLEELHVGIHALLARAHLLMHEMLDEPVGRMLERLFFGADHVRGMLIGGAELGGTFDVVDPEGAGLAPDMGEITFFCGFHFSLGLGGGFLGRIFCGEPR
jgi:hypothetical protein